ncbi:aminotransferase [Daedaleopsis nitida]|nr:aminotransferase [Daedaleopsis nitida]
MLSMSSTDYLLLSTTRGDPQLAETIWNTDANAGFKSRYLLLLYHCDRLIQAAQQHHWPVPTELTPCFLESRCNDAIAALGGSPITEGCYRVAHAVNPTVVTSPLPYPDPMAASLWLPSASTPDPPFLGPDLLTVYLDTAPTPASLFTRTKTTYRDHYNAARDRSDLPPLPTSSPFEVVLHNEDDEITETSIRNIAFVRRSPPRWVTPHASSGCLPGVCRRWLLEQGRIIEADAGELKKAIVRDGEYVLTFNGVEGCRLGRVKLHSA